MENKEKQQIEKDTLSRGIIELSHAGFLPEGVPNDEEFKEILDKVRTDY